VRELVVFFHSEVVKSCSREKKLLKEHTSEVTVNLGFVLEKCHLNLRWDEPEGNQQPDEGDTPQ